MEKWKRFEVKNVGKWLGLIPRRFIRSPAVPPLTVIWFSNLHKRITKIHLPHSVIGLFSRAWDWLCSSWVINPWGLITCTQLAGAPDEWDFVMGAFVYFPQTQVSFSIILWRLRKRGYKRKSLPSSIIRFLTTTMAEAIVKVHLRTDLTQHWDSLDKPVFKPL